MRVAQSQPLSTTMMKHETQKRDAWKKIGHATNSTETASGPSPESHRKHEPSPEFNDIKSSPDHPIHLTTGNYRELTTTTEKPPPTTVLEISSKLRPPYTTTKRHTARALASERCDAESEAGCSLPTERESTGGRGRTTIRGTDATPESKTGKPPARTRRFISFFSLKNILKREKRKRREIFRSSWH
ncbi:hypothetical protein YC2023_062271 [Brassica napus]